MSVGTGLATAKAFRNLTPTDPFRRFREGMNRLFEEGYENIRTARL